MDRNLWKTFINYPSWSCPECQKGYLRIVPGTVLKCISRKERFDLAKDGSRRESLERFTAHLCCDYGACSETATIVGDYYEGWFADGSEDGFTDIGYRPLHIFPCPLPFRLTGSVPRAIKDRLQQAASLFWSDPKAAAGRLREVVEAIVTDLGVDDVSPKGKRLNLH